MFSEQAALSVELLGFIRTIAGLVILGVPILLSSKPLRPVKKRLGYIIPDLVSIDSLVPAEPATPAQKAKGRKNGIKVWQQFIFVFVGLAEVAAWTVTAGLHIVRSSSNKDLVRHLLLDAGMILIWIWLALRPAFRGKSTPMWSSLATNLVIWVISLITLASIPYDKTMTGVTPAWATKERIIAETANALAITLLIITTAGLKLLPPEKLARLPSVGADDKVTLASWLSFSWVNPFIQLGNSKELNVEDLPSLSLTMQSTVVFDRFRQMSYSTLVRRLFMAHRFDVVVDFTLTLCSVVFNYAGPFFLQRILQGLTDRTPEALTRAYVFAALAFLSSTLKAMSDVLHLWHGRRACVRIRAELTAAIYDKALRRKDASGVLSEKETEGDDKKKEDKDKKSNADTGKIVNLMAGDTMRISNILSGAYFLYSSPFELIVASVFLYNILGWSAFAGIGVLVFAVPLNSFLSKKSIKITQELLKARDKRIGVMTELLGAIQFIKFFAWIEQWKGRAADARKQEMRTMIKSIINGIWFSLLWYLVPILVTLSSFFCYIVIAKRELSVSVAFTALNLFMMLRAPLNVIPTYIVIILQCHVAVKRIEDFLEEEEVPDWVSSLKRDPNDRASKKAEIGFKNATLRWNTGKTVVDKKNSKADKKTTPSPTVSEDDTVVEPIVFKLSDLTIAFPIGKLSVITGPTGSGKTALLTALLGEMDLLEGTSYLPKDVTSVDNESGLRNSVAYASQTPWLQQKSIKDNILFGEEFDEARYEATLDACALQPDLDVLEDGDQTEIGAKGVSLSGGQKARVALARAVYSYTKILLLDDPLAAVDSHTAKHLTDHCLNGPLLKNRTVILVSHHVELLVPSAHYLVRILDGRVEAQGTPDELRAAGQLDGIVALEEAEAGKAEPITTSDEVEQEVKAAEGEPKKEKKKGPGKKLIQDEERAVGNVKWGTYKLYIESATYTVWVLAFVCLGIMQLFMYGEKYWLKVWGEAYITHARTLMTFFRSSVSLNNENYHHHSVHQHVLSHSSILSNHTTKPDTPITAPIVDRILHLPSPYTNPGYYLAGYAIIVLSSALIDVVDGIIGSWGQYRAAVTIHNKLLDVMMRGSIRFFTVTPVGRIINRFSRDIETIDGSLTSAVRIVITYIANLIGAVVVVAIVVPWFLLPAAVISYLYWRYSVAYLKVGRSLRRLEATLKSPIFSGFAELLDGVVTVRAFSVERRFLDQLCDQVDKTNTAFYYYWMMNRWLLLRFDVLGAVSVFFTTIFTLTGTVSPGSAGLAILSAQSFVSACYWVSRFWGQLEMDFNAVERVQEYLQIPQEPPAVIEGHRPPAYWPLSNSGDHFLSAQDLEIKYAPDLPTVFKGSFDIKAGEKIGLIGRTGSGKSTLAMSLLRFTEPTGGAVYLDGIDITSIGVDDLRSRITYIPQDAVLFSGTVRENLDPFNEHNDDELLDALARVNLGPLASPTQSRAVSRHPSSSRLAALAAEEAKDNADSLRSSSGKVTITLTTEISAGGSNFSQGQRQLVAMARALLRRSNLIIMDEATASVDFATDEAIQRAIRSEFKSSTLLTIAHRLSSVIDYDRLLVLADGGVAEFDTPINLLRKDGSLFKNLCEKSGKFKELYKAAEKKEKSDQ